MAVVIDRLAVLSWQYSGNPKAPKPKPFPRPGVEDPTIRHGQTTRPAAEVVAYLRRFAPVRQEVTDG